MSKKNNLNYIPASAKTAAQRQEEAKQQRRSRASANLSPADRKKLIFKRVWTLSVITLCLVLVLTLSLIFATYEQPLYEEITNTAPSETGDDGLIKNQEFSFSKLLYNGLLSSAVAYPYLPDNWSLTDSSSANSTVNGIISLDDGDKGRVTQSLKGMGLDDSTVNTLLDKTGFAITQEEGEEQDANVMLFYNKTAANARVTSNSFSVPVSGYLKITVRIRSDITTGDGAFIALGTTSTYSAETATMQFAGIDTAGEWREYTFYVEGNKTSTRTVYLFVGLGTSSSAVQGWAEVDYAKAESCKKVDYLTAESQTADAIKTHTFVQNANETPVDISLITAGAIDNNGQTVSYLADNSEAGELPFADSVDIYKVSNTDGQGAYIKFAQRFLVNQSTATPYYRFSFWAKTTDITNNNTGAYFYAVIYETSADGMPLQSYIKSFDMVKTSESESDVNSGWAEYSFLLQPDNTKSYYVEFVFSLGQLRLSDVTGKYDFAAADFPTVGNLFLTEFEMQEIYQSEYTSATEGSSIVKVSVTDSTSTGLITNGNFDSPVSNAYAGTTTSVPVGYDPNGWSVNFPRHQGDNGYIYTPHSSTDVLFGIVANNASDADKTNYLGADFGTYFGHTGDDNILAVNVKNATAIGFVSNKFTLSANSYYIVSFLVKANDYSSLHAYLTGDIEQKFDISALSEDDYFVVNEYVGGGYLKYNFIIKTGDSSKSVALELWVGDKDASYENGAWTGLAAANTIVAFDEAKTQTITQDKFNEIVESKENDANVFTKTETTAPVLDADGKETGKTEVTDVTYTTQKGNVWVRDYTYVDASDAVQSDDTTTDEETPQPVAPVDFLLLSSLVLSIAVIVFLIVMIVKKFKFVKKRDAMPDDPDYKK